MTDRPVGLRYGGHGDPMFEVCLDAMNRMRAAVANVVTEAEDPRDGLTIIMTAAAMFAGVQGGTLLAMGALQNQDRRRMVETAMTNFRQGVEFGLKRGLHVGADVAGGRA